MCGFFESCTTHTFLAPLGALGGFLLVGDREDWVSPFGHHGITAYTEELEHFRCLVCYLFSLFRCRRIDLLCGVAFVGVSPNLALPTRVGAFGRLSYGWDIMDCGSPFVSTEKIAFTEEPTHFRWVDTSCLVLSLVTV